MIRTLIENLKSKKKELIDTSSRVAIEEKKEEYEEKIDLTIDQYKNFFRMQISDYMPVGEYSKRVDELDPDKMCDNISMSIFWNSGKQKVNKGTFYVLLIDNRIYNFWIDGNEVMIDERVKFDEESHERIFSYDLSSENYRLVFFKHNSFGSTFHNMYYPTEECLEKFCLTREEARTEIKGLLERVLDVENVLDIVDVNSIKQKVLNDLGPEGIKKEYKN